MRNTFIALSFNQIIQQKVNNPVRHFFIPVFVHQRQQRILNRILYFQIMCIQQQNNELIKSIIPEISYSIPEFLGNWHILFDDGICNIPPIAFVIFDPADQPSCFISPELFQCVHTCVLRTIYLTDTLYQNTNFF